MICSANQCLSLENQTSRGPENHLAGRFHFPKNTGDRMRRGPKPRKNVLREPSGRVSRTREGQLQAGAMVYPDYAVYFAQDLSGLTKVGFSGNLKHRLIMLSAELGEKVRIVGLALVPSEMVARKLEATMHKRFAPQRDHGEWFALSEGHIRTALADCRALKLKTVGAEEDGPERSIVSSLVAAREQNTVSLFAKYAA